MTVATQLILVKYLGDDVAVTFPFTFPVYDEDHLQVYLQDTTTLELVQLSSSVYSVTGIGDESGGSVVTDDPVSSDNNILLVRVLDFTQDLDVLNQGGFYPQNFEAQLDLQEMQIQQVNQEVNRSVRGPIDNEWPELPQAPLRRARLLGFTDDENAYPTVETFDIFFNILGSILRAGFGIEITLNYPYITITNTAPGSGELQECWLLEDASAGGGGPGATDAEFIRDVIGAAMQGLGCEIVVDDVANTITVDCTQDATAEVIRDVMGVTLVAGANITITPSDIGNTITIAATGGGGGQPLDATLTALAGLTTAANQMIYSTGVDAFSMTTLTSFARTLLDDADAATMRATLGIGGVAAGTFGANTVSITIPLSVGTLLIQGGKGTLAGNTTGTVTYPTAYSVAPVVLVSGGPSDTASEGSVHNYGTPSTTAVTINNSSGFTNTYTWIAIGKA